MSSIPAEPWRLDADDPATIVDANSVMVLTAASATIARHVLALHTSAVAPAKERPANVPPRIERTRTYRTPDELAPFAPEGAAMPTLPTIGLVAEEHFARERERLADPVAWERKIAEEKALAERDAKAKVAREAAGRREAWIDRAIARGCPQHRPTMLAAMSSKQTPAMDKVREALKWYKSHQQGPLTTGAILVLCGSNGAGKTTAVTRAVATWAEPARFVTADFIAGLPDNDWSEYIQKRDELLAPQVLAIDECGMEASKAAGRRVWSIMLKRYNLGKLTLVTTNLDKKLFMLHYMATRGNDGKPVPDEKVLSRLNNEQSVAGLEPFVTLPEHDYRGQS